MAVQGALRGKGEGARGGRNGLFNEVGLARRPRPRWWVELLKDGERVAYMSMTEWEALGATEQAIEDNAIDRATAADPAPDVQP